MIKKSLAEPILIILHQNGIDKIIISGEDSEEICLAFSVDDNFLEDSIIEDHLEDNRTNYD